MENNKSNIHILNKVCFLLKLLGNTYKILKKTDNLKEAIKFKENKGKDKEIVIGERNGLFYVVSII